MEMKRIISLTAAMMLAVSTFAASLETDRPWYLAGERMTVSIPFDDALIAYAELCDTYSLAAGTVVSLKGGKGTGYIELPADLHSGYYVLSVYTRHSAQVSNQLVAVVNPLRKSEDDDIEWVESGVGSQETGAEVSVAQFDDFNAVEYQSNRRLEPRETEGHIIKARVRNVYEGQTFRAGHIRPSIGIVGKQIHYFEGKMVNDSTAVFYTFGVHGKKPLVLSAASSTGISLPIEMISPFATLLPKRLPHLVFHYNRSEVEARSVAMQRHQIAIAPAKQELQIGVHTADVPLFPQHRLHFFDAAAVEEQAEAAGGRFRPFAVKLPMVHAEALGQHCPCQVFSLFAEG